MDALVVMHGKPCLHSYLVYTYVCLCIHTNLPCLIMAAVYVANDICCGFVMNMYGYEHVWL